jgi:AbrB family looped-hinge helix DNA binding protein
MALMDITKMSSKGQIVIPAEMRKNFKEGDNFVVTNDEDRIILVRTKRIVDKDMKEDLEFAKRTEEAWKEYEKGKFISKSADEFLKALEKC